MQTQTLLQGNDPFELISSYGSPLYVYNEAILRGNCRKLKNMVTYPAFRVNFSVKANCNLAILQIIRQEGLHVDAMSAGEIYVQRAAGFTPEEIFFVPNNVSSEEIRYAAEQGILTSADSLSQLERLGKILPGGRVAVRFNPGIGVGHHEKVVTGGKNTKFGINQEYIPEVKNIVERYRLKLVAVNQHIGSLFMEADKFMEGIQSLLTIAKQFPDLEIIDFGGGFGIPYRKQENEAPLDINTLGKKLDDVMYSFSKEYGKELIFAIEPGRYIPAEAGLLLGCVHAVKHNGNTKYVGCDIGFNVLMRTVLYDSHHDIEVFKQDTPKPSNEAETEVVTVVGNICESGDILARNISLPTVREGDLICVQDAGAYGFVMSSNYNNRLRPAEVLIRENGMPVLIRKRDVLEDLISHNIYLEEAKP